MKCNLPEEKQEKVSGNFGMNLYDLNKSLISQMPALTLEQIIRQKEVVVDPFLAAVDSDYYMLLCNELKYYTIFNVMQGLSDSLITEELFACLNEFCDEVKSIEKTDDGCAIEIWFTKDEETYVMYFFDYAGGVIHCGK